MSEVTVTYPKWSQISQKLSASGGLASVAIKALKDFGNEKVHLLSAPYGTQLIKNGAFDWSLLGTESGQRAGFGSGPIPLGLVVSGAIELYTHDSYETAVRRETRTVQRSVPVFLLRKGDFFGLFETFAPLFSQPELNGDAGGTTLVVLPHIGNREKFGRMKSIDKGDYLHGTPSKERFVIRSADTDHLQIIDGSNLAFGPFFANLLDQIACPWRVELALLPKVFVDRIRKNPAAHQALLAATIDQLSLSCVRLETTDDLNRKVRANVRDHVLAVSMIARGYRPGFSPVLESDVDETVLPAKAIHKLLYDLEVCETVGNKHFFPTIFRPSFASEPSYYFLNRPYFRTGNGRSSIHELITDITSQAHKYNKCSKHFVPTGGKELEATLHAAYSALPAKTREVCLGNSAFITGGCIAIKPLSEESS